MNLDIKITKILIIWYLLILGVAFLGYNYIPRSGIYSGSFLEMFSNWDGKHFLAIARNGYAPINQVVFFPLYPVLIKVASFVTKDYLLTSLLISIVSSFFAIHYFFKLILLDFKKEVAEKAVVFLLLFPTSFFLVSSYSEGLFFLLVVLTFYFARQKKYLPAVLFAALASGTRLAGVAVVVGLFFEVYKSKELNSKNWFVLFAPLGFLIYCGYLYFLTGSPFFFIQAEGQWGRFLRFPGEGMLLGVFNLVLFKQPNSLNILMEILFTIFGVGLILRSLRFVNRSYTVYGLTSLIFPIATNLLLSIPRFLLPIFPIFITLSLIRNRWVTNLFQLSSLILLVIFLVMFINGYWVS